MDKRSVCVLASGGMDSAVLLGESLRRFGEVHPLFVRSGLVWEKAELHWLKRFLRALRSPRLKPLAVVAMPAADLYGRHWSLSRRRVPGYRSRDERVYLPGRNILLLSKAATFCAIRGIPVLRIGVLKGNPFPDGAPAFFRVMEKAVRIGLRSPLSIQAPFRAMTKRQVMDRAGALPLHLTFSCLAPRGVHPCGRCNKCAERDRLVVGSGRLSRPAKFAMMERIHG